MFMNCKLEVDQLFLDDNKIDDKIMSHLGEFINKKQVYEINLSRNNVSDEGIELLTKSLPFSDYFRSLNISGNKLISDKSTNNFVKILKESYIDTIGYHNISIDDEDKIEIELLINGIKNNSESLELSE